MIPKTADFLTRKIPIDCLSVKIRQFTGGRPAVSIIRSNMKESIGSQVYLFIECTFRYVAPVTTGREKWKTVGDATRQYQEENPRRIWRNINVAWKMKSICIYTYIKSIRGAMTRGQTFIFSKFHSVLFFWLTKRIAVKFHSFFPLLVRIQTFSFSFFT